MIATGFTGGACASNLWLSKWLTKIDCFLRLSLTHGYSRGPETTSCTTAFNKLAFTALDFTSCDSSASHSPINLSTFSTIRFCSEIKSNNTKIFVDFLLYFNLIVYSKLAKPMFTSSLLAVFNCFLADILL